MIKTFILVCVGAALLGVEPEAPTSGSVTSDRDAIADHLAFLDAKISQLEKRGPQGSGAFRRGASFLVEGGGSESVLERLRRLEQELSQARNDLTARDATVAELRNKADTELKRAEGLNEKADGLSHVRDNLVAAQQTLAERQVFIDRLNQRIAESDLARLQGERAYFSLAASLLRLEAGRGQDLLELQEQVRQQAKILRPADSLKKSAGK